MNFYNAALRLILLSDRECANSYYKEGRSVSRPLNFVNKLFKAFKNSSCGHYSIFKLPT